jgi:hypothetical protein
MKKNPKTPVITGWRVEMIMIGSGVLVNYYEGEPGMCLAIAESLRRGKTGGRVLEVPTGRLIAEWEPDSLEIKVIS